MNEILIRHCDWWVIQVIYENCLPYNLIGLFYYIIFICTVEHTSEALHVCGKFSSSFFFFFLSFHAFTIYEFGHSFNCGSVRKNKDKFVAVRNMSEVMWWRVQAIKNLWWIVFMMMRLASIISDQWVSFASAHHFKRDSWNIKKKKKKSFFFDDNDVDYDKTRWSN